MIIALNSLPGSGVEHISKLMALQLGIKYLSKKAIITKIAKEGKKTVQEVEETIISEKTMEKMRSIVNKEAKNTNIILDWPLSCWLAENPVKIFIYSSEKNRAETLTKKAKVPLSDAKEKLSKEESELKKDMLSLFGANIYDIKNFDIVINMDKISAENAGSIILKYIKNIEVR